METCFVMQPFDGAAFDKRFEDVFTPAIRAAGIEPYRVDKDPSVVIPIEDIEAGIRKADYCLAEITTDNPNVWYELGYAIRDSKYVVLVCSEERKTNFPFDVRHRSIIKYKTESARDFDALCRRITEALVAARAKKNELASIDTLSPVVKTEGLSEHEVVALVVTGQNTTSPSDWVPVGVIRRDMERAGFTEIASALALRSLLRKEFLECETFNDFREGEYTGYSVTNHGFDWLETNKERLELRRRPPKALIEEEIPF